MLSAALHHRQEDPKEGAKLHTSSLVDLLAESQL